MFVSRAGAFIWDDAAKSKDYGKRATEIGHLSESEMDGTRCMILLDGRMVSQTTFRQVQGCGAEFQTLLVSAGEGTGMCRVLNNQGVGKRSRANSRRFIN